MPQSPLVAAIAQAFGTTALKLLGVGKQNDLLVNELTGTKYTSAYNGLLFNGANQSGVTTSAGLATTYVGICLSNPITSLVNLALRRVSGALIVAPATVTGIALATGFNATTNVTHTTPLTPASSKIGSGLTAAGKLDSSATLPTAPVYAQMLSETPTATTLLSFTVDLEGGVLLVPGAYAIIATTIAGPTSGFMGAMEWEEMPA